MNQDDGSTKDQILRPRQAVVAVIVRNSKFLAIKRSETVRAPGKICFPGGSIEHNETEREAVERELLEELGVQVSPRTRVFSNRSPWGVQLNWWTAELPESQIPIANEAEVAEILWLSLQELRDHVDLLTSNIVFLNAVQQGTISLQ